MRTRCPRCGHVAAIRSILQVCVACVVAVMEHAPDRARTPKAEKDARLRRLAPHR